jgi:hypothetical protein
VLQKYKVDSTTSEDFTDPEYAVCSELMVPVLEEIVSFSITYLKSLQDLRQDYGGYATDLYSTFTPGALFELHHAAEDFLSNLFKDAEQVAIRKRKNCTVEPGDLETALSLQEKKKKISSEWVTALYKK